MLGNDSMLTIMMKQSNRKKFSQKTNDMKTKAVIEYLVSVATNTTSLVANATTSGANIALNGNEYLDVVLFNHLIGFQPKYSTKLSAGKPYNLFLLHCLFVLTSNFVICVV